MQVGSSLVLESLVGAIGYTCADMVHLGWRFDNEFLYKW